MLQSYCFETARLCRGIISAVKNRKNKDTGR
jgi:hypothetical protein